MPGRCSRGGISSRRGAHGLRGKGSIWDVGSRRYM